MAYCLAGVHGQATQKDEQGYEVMGSHSAENPGGSTQLGGGEGGTEHVECERHLESKNQGPWRRRLEWVTSAQDAT